jgi:hypothetical protein
VFQIAVCLFAEALQLQRAFREHIQHRVAVVFEVAGFVPLAFELGKLASGKVRVLPVEVLPRIWRAVALKAGIENDERHTTDLMSA